MRSSSAHPALVVDNVAPRPAPASSDNSITDRAKLVALQMRYFLLVARKCAFHEMLPSASRAGFTLLEEDAGKREARLRWAEGEPDFVFSVSYRDPDKVSVVAEARGDIAGLVLIGHSHVSDISVEMNPWLAEHELGRSAATFRDDLLALPDFVATPAWVNY